MKRIWTIFLLLACVQASFAQPNPDTLWTRTYGGASNERARSVQQTTDGGYILAGDWTGSELWGACCLAKIDGLGNLDWVQTYRSTGAASAVSVWQTTDGGYVAAGQGTRLCLIRTNSQGDTIWTRRYSGDGEAIARSVQQTEDGGYIVTGDTDDPYEPPSYPNIFLAKFDNAGTLTWAHTYGGGSYDRAYCVQQTMDGGYIVAGETMSFGAGSYDYFLVKTTPLGDTIWTRTYGGQSADQARSVQETRDGGYIIGGFTSSFGTGGDFCLVRTNDQGNQLWLRTYEGGGLDEGWSVQETMDGGFVLGGYSFYFPMNADFYMLKTNSQGSRIWARTYGGSAHDYAYSLDLTADGGFVLAGYTESFGAGSSDFYVVKTGPDISRSEPLLDPIPSACALHANYPNPFNPVTTICYDVNRTGLISLKVCDLLGRKVATLVQGTIPVGSYTVTWDAGNLPSGLYFCRMEAGEFVQTRKMVLLK